MRRTRLPKIFLNNLNVTQGAILRLIVFASVFTVSTLIVASDDTEVDFSPLKAFVACRNLYQDKHLDEALICFADLVKQPNTTPTQAKIESYRMMARIAVDRGELAFARDLLVHALDEIPTSTDLQFLLCRVSYLEKKYEIAIGVCNKGFSMMDLSKKAENDLHLQALITVGDSYWALGKYDAAKGAYEALKESKLQAYRDIGARRLKELKELKAPPSQTGLRDQLPLRRRYINSRVSDPVYQNYLVVWRDRVQKVGNTSFSEELKGKGLSGRVLLSVDIMADGSLGSIEVRRTSGYRALDEAAERIAKQAAPFTPLPPEILKDTDILNITTIWKFKAPGGPNLE